MNVYIYVYICIFDRWLATSLICMHTYIYIYVYMTGDWQQDRRHGSGSMAHANGDVYTGPWSDDMRQGEYIYLYVYVYVYMYVHIYLNIYINFYV